MSRLSLSLSLSLRPHSLCLWCPVLHTRNTHASYRSLHVSHFSKAPAASSGKPEPAVASIGGQASQVASSSAAYETSARQQGCPDCHTIQEATPISAYTKDQPLRTCQV